jgi:DUSAM domain-containing protein
MEYRNAELDALWHQVRTLDNQVRQGVALELTDEVLDLLRLVVPTVGMSETEAERTLSDVESATVLLHEVRRRITEGSHRLMRSLEQMYTLRDEGDLDGARQQMRDLLAVEVVPYYREIAEDEIEKLNEFAQ